MGLSHLKVSSLLQLPSICLGHLQASKAVYEDQCAVLQSALLNSRRQMSAMEATALDVECAAVSQIQLLAEDRETLAMLSESQAEKILRLERELAVQLQGHQLGEGRGGISV